MMRRAYRLDFKKVGHKDKNRVIGRNLSREDAFGLKAIYSALSRTGSFAGQLANLTSEKGAVSVAFVMGALLTLFILSITSLSHIGNDSRSATNILAKSKALYAAEGGIELVLGDLKNGGTGEFTDLAIGDALVSSTIDGDTLVTISATANDITQNLQLVVKTQGGNLPDAFYYAVSTFDGNKKLKFQGSHSVYLKGEVLTYNDQEVEFEENWVLEDVTVHVEEGTYIDNKTGYSITVNEFSQWEAPLEWPQLDTQVYDDYINNVGGYANYGCDCEGEGDDDYDDPETIIDDDLNLNSFPDNVLFSDCRITIEHHADITGPGIIVSTDDIRIKDGSDIGPDVWIISAKDIKVYDRSEVFGMGSILFAKQDIDIEDRDTSVEGSIISEDDIKIDCDEDNEDRGIIKGIIFAKDKLDISHARIHGSVVADYIDDEDFHCTHIKFDTDYLPTTAVPGLLGTGIAISVVAGTWRAQ